MMIVAVIMAYSFAVACFLNFFLLQNRLKGMNAFMERANARRLAAQGKAAGDAKGPKAAPPFKVAFLHPDLGIGGAERLMIDAAVGLQRRQTVAPVKVIMVTNHHDPKRAFPETTDGTLDVIVRGGWMPSSFFGRGKVFCATSRMIWSAFATCWTHPDVDCYFIDQVSAVLPLLRLFAPKVPIIFYCHFPDQLCDPNRDLNGAFDPKATWMPGHLAYRSFFDQVEAWSMPYATNILCNSRFSRSVTVKTFPFLIDRISEENDIFYPPVAALEAGGASASSAEESSSKVDLEAMIKGRTAFVSINRYERKKDITLALEAFTLVLKEKQAAGEASSLILVVAGGYDSRVPENVEYYAALRKLASSTLAIPNEQILFLQNITEREKEALLSHMQALLYTPSNEHFGIVPVEAMMRRKPVIAVSHGGPCESVGDMASEEDASGLLCPGDAASFAAAMKRLLDDKSLADRLGANGMRRVKRLFSIEAFSTKLATRIKTLNDDAARVFFTEEEGKNERKTEVEATSNPSNTDTMNQ